MCGRYEMFMNPENVELQQMIHRVNQKYGADIQMKFGEIFPTNQVPILALEDQEITPELFIWGFPNFRNKGVLINARSETAMEKPTFKKSLLERRCVIPSTGFYEWKQDGSKQKYRFRIPGEENLYMAGLWNDFKGERRFVILTTAANGSMQEIHHRMPVVLHRHSVDMWIKETETALEILREVPPMLQAEKVS